MRNDELRRVIEIYDRDVLTSEVGETALKERLLGGLEDAIRRVNPHFISSKDFDGDILDREINYELLADIDRRVPGQTVVKRLRKRLEEAGIKTYRDLVRHVRANVDCIIEDEYTCRDVGIEGVGPKSCGCLYAHLHALGIKLFGTEYTSDELDYYDTFVVGIGDEAGDPAP